MTNDDFLTGLRADWRQARVDLERMKRLSERRQRRGRLLQAGNLLGAAAAALLVLWFAYRAVETRDALFAVGAVAFLASLPLIVLEYLTSRRDLSVQYDDTPRGVLLQARHHAEAARRLLGSGRWAAAILMASAAAALTFSAAGWTAPSAALPIAAVWAAVATLVWLWQAWRARRLRAEVEGRDRLLAELGDADRAEDGG